MVTGLGRTKKGAVRPKWVCPGEIFTICTCKHGNPASYNIAVQTDKNSNNDVRIFTSVSDPGHFTHLQVDHEVLHLCGASFLYTALQSW